MSKSAEYMRECRLEWRRLGLCLACGKRDATKTRCDECAVKHRAWAKSITMRSAALGMCRYCYHRRADGESPRCTHCKAVNAAYQRRYRRGIAT